MKECGQAYQLCPCHKESKEFQKIWELKDSGLMVYCHRTVLTDVRQGDCTTNTIQDAFILDNEKNVKITSSELNTELEKKNISCPRCRQIFRHAQELLKKVKSIDRETVIGICDHCRKSTQTSKKPLCICDEIVKKYISVKDTEKENIKTNVKIWLSKLGHILKDETTHDKPKQIKTSSFSDIQINQTLKSPPVSKHEPEIQQMFTSVSQKSDINIEISGKDLKEGTQTVTFAEPIEPVETSFAHTTYEGEQKKTTTPATSMADSDTTIVEVTHVGVKDLSRPSLKGPKQEIPSIDAKEALKRKHDLSLRHMMGFQKDSSAPYYVTERPDIYEIPKSAPREQKKPTSEDHMEPEMVKKIPIPTKPKHDLRRRETFDPDYAPVKSVTYGSSKTSEKDVQDHYFQVKKRKEFYTADETLKLQRSVTKFGHKTKKPHVTKSKSIPIPTAESVLEPEFSFLFPEEKKKEEMELTLDVSSSHLIKETQEKFHLQAEREKQRQEEERRQKHEQEQENRLAQEQKKLQAEEEKILADEFKKYVEEHKTLQKDLDTISVSEDEKQDKSQRHKLKDDISSKEGELISKHELKGKETGESKKDLKSKSKKGFKSETEQKDKIDDDLQKDKMDLKSKPEQRIKIHEDSQKVIKESKSKLEQKDKIDEDLQKAKKDSKSKLEKKDKTDVDLQKAKKDFKSKPEQEDKHAKEKSEPKEKGGVKVTEKETKDMKGKPEQKAKDDGNLTSKAMTSQKETPKSKGKDEEKEKDSEGLKTSTKTDKDQQDEKKEQDKLEKEQKSKAEEDKQLTQQEEHEKREKEKEAQEKNLQIKKEHEQRMKEAEQLRKEKEALKQQPMKDKENVSKETDAPSKSGKPTKKTDEKPTKKTDEKPTKKSDEKPTKKSDGKPTKKNDELTVSLTDIQKSMKKEKSKQDISNKAEKEIKDSKKKTSKTELRKNDKAAEEFKKMQAEHLKDREVRLKQKKQQEYEAKLAKVKEVVEQKVKQLELNMRDVKVQKTADKDDAILKLVMIKQTAKVKVKACDVDAKLIHKHKCHQHRGAAHCPLCDDSELELEVLSLENKTNLKTTITDVIIGEHIIKNKRRGREKPKEPKHFPSLYHRHYFGQHPRPHTDDQTEVTSPQEPEPQKKGAAFLMAKNNADGVEVEPGKGILRYALSDRTFIEKGWTMLPTEKVVRKMNVYRMRPAHPEFNWFEHNKKKRLITYDTGEKLAEFDDNGRGRLYYRSGRLALDYYDAEETNAQQRFVTYSSGEPDERGRTHPITILATFDYLGNGIVFDHAGKIRLKYNQTEGVVLDRGIGPVSHWKWHTLNDPPVLQQVMIDTQMTHKDPYIFKLGSFTERPGRPDNEEMLAIEFDNFIKEKSKKLSQKFKPFQIKMKALKINEHFSLKVLDQATVYLIFRDGSTNVKLNIGMVLDHQEIVDTDTAEVGEVSNSLERFPARTDSLAGLQRSVAYAQRYERQNTERERRLRPSEPCASADQLTAAASRPMRPPFRTMPPGGTTSSTSTGYCSRKPASNLYYNTRLL